VAVVTMSRVLVPRSSACSSKIVASCDWTLYHGCVLTDHVICGFTISVGCGTRDIDIAAGSARILGLHLCNTVACTGAVACLAVCDVHSIYIQVNRDCMCRPSNFTFTSNTTGCTAVDAFKIGTATTDCTGTTASVTTIGSAQETGIGQGTSFPAEYVTDTPFWRTDSNYFYKNDNTEASPVWSRICGDSGLFGDGGCGNVTICCCTDLMCDNHKNYSCLTINACQILEADSPFIIRVHCTLTINGTISGIGKGGAGATTASQTGTEGDGGSGSGTLRIYAKTILGTGTIISDGVDVTDSTSAVVGCANGGSGCDGCNDGVSVNTAGNGGSTTGDGGGGGAADGNGGDGGGCGVGRQGGTGYTVNRALIYGETTG